MQKNRDRFKIQLKSEQDFPKFLKSVRTKQNIQLKQLSKGLMSESRLARIEKGQRPANKNMRDRLLGRLGIANDLYENLLDIKDYNEWEWQRNILCAIEKKETREAWKLIAQYEKVSPVKDKIKQQFCLMMRAELLKHDGAGWQELGDCYEKAVKLTIPDIQHINIEDSLLSIQEINMVLEYEFYHKNGNFAEKCKESLKVCNQAVEILRDTGRAYYLTELLDMKCKILKSMGNISAEYVESMALADLLKKLYAEHNLPEFMQDCTYLYRQRWVFYIGDVMRIRRKMYGFTQEELCREICSVKTLRRTEKKQADMQQKMLGAVLNRLGLCNEYQRTRLVTNDSEVVRLNEELAVCRNNHEPGKARELLRQIETKVSAEIHENRQYLIEAKASLDWMEGKIKKEDFSARMEEALQCTLNIARLSQTDKIYLTEMEMSCLCKRIQGLGGMEKNKYIDLLLHFFECYEHDYGLPDCIVMYEFVMVRLASELTGAGKHQLAADIDTKVLGEALKCRRVGSVCNILYDILWNEKVQKAKYGQGVDEQKMTEVLQNCIILSHFCKQTYSENFLCGKMRQLREVSCGGKSLQGEAGSSPA